MRTLFIGVLLALVGTLVCQERSPAASEGGALDVAVNGPSDLAYHDGFLYIAESAGQRLLRLDISRGTIEVVLPRLTGDDEEYDYPSAIAVGSDGKVFIGSFDGRLKELEPSSGRLSVLLPKDSFDLPESAAIDGHGDLLIVDRRHHLVRWLVRERRLETIAGTGIPGYGGDGSTPKKAKLHFPSGVAVNAAGEIFIADYENCRIRKLDARLQAISTYAGTGECDSNGDGGPALQAALNYPSSLAVDAAGNLYFVEGATDRVRRITPDGIIATFAGNGQKGFNGDGGPADRATLNNPSGVAVDEAGNVFISEYVNNRIRRVDADTYRISTIAGNGKPER